MKVVILSKGSMLINLIKGAQDAGCDVVGVLRYEKVVLNKLALFFHDFFKTNPDVTFINKFRIPQVNTTSANSEEFRKFLIKNNVDLLLVGTWREKLEKETFNIPKIGTINLHPSLLPKYRGANPYFNAIKNGEEKSGLTFHLVDEKFDHGAMLRQKEIEISPLDTSKELKNKIVFETRAMVSKLLHDISNDAIIPLEQNEKFATYCSPITKDDLMLVFTQKTAEEISSTIRAIHPFAPTYIAIGRKFLIPNPYKLTIIEDVDSDAGTIIAKDALNSSLTIACKGGQAIKMDGLKLYGIFNHPFTKLFIKTIRI